MAPANCSFLSRPPSRPRWHRDSCRAERSLGSLKPSPATATDFIAAERKFTEICIFARLLAELDAPPTIRHHAETSATVIADLGMPNHTFVHGQAPVCILSGALCMSSAAAHWSPAVTELVQLVRTRWRDNFRRDKETVSIVFRDAQTSANVRLSFSLLLGTIAFVG